MCVYRSVCVCVFSGLERSGVEESRPAVELEISVCSEQTRAKEREGERDRVKKRDMGKERGREKLGD